MLVSTKGRYALSVIIDLAEHDNEGYIPLSDIAARQGISKKYLEAFTASLAKTGILGIKRGKSGGYRLIADPKTVTLWDVLCATEGPLHAVACLENPVNECARCGYCITLPAWEGLEKVVRDYLESVSLQQLIDQAKPQPPSPESFPCGA